MRGGLHGDGPGEQLGGVPDMKVLFKSGGVPEMRTNEPTTRNTKHGDLATPHRGDNGVGITLWWTRRVGERVSLQHETRSTAPQPHITVIAVWGLHGGGRDE